MPILPRLSFTAVPPNEADPTVSEADPPPPIPRPTMEAEAEAPPVERLHQRGREVRLSLEPQEFSRDLGRRSEITPERRVQFRPNSRLTPREIEHGEGSADEEFIRKSKVACAT